MDWGGGGGATSSSLLLMVIKVATRSLGCYLVPGTYLLTVSNLVSAALPD